MPSIVEVSAEPLNVELVEPFGIATGAQLAAENVLVLVRLDDGSVGMGEAAPFTAVSGETQADALAAVAAASEPLRGLDASRWRYSASLLRELAPRTPSARCAVESALLDALCRSAGVSLWRFFGGAVPTLETDITVPTGDADTARRAAERAAAQGFRTLKVKVGGAPLEHDVERLRAIGAAAPEARLVLDANASLSTDEALALLDALAAIRRRIALFEQPTAPGDFDALRAVRERGKVPVAADESARSAADVVTLAEGRCVDVVNVKIMKCGVAEAVDMIATAHACRLGLMVGGMVETALAMGVSACIAAGMGGFEFVDLDTPLFMRDAPTVGGPERRGPHIALDDVAAGHGVRIRGRA